MSDDILYNFILLGPIDDIDLDQFDPDGVDFEPLLVSGSKLQPCSLIYNVFIAIATLYNMSLMIMLSFIHSIISW